MKKKNFSYEIKDFQTNDMNPSTFSCRCSNQNHANSRKFFAFRFVHFILIIQWIKSYSEENFVFLTNIYSDFETTIKKRMEYSSHVFWLISYILREREKKRRRLTHSNLLCTFYLCRLRPSWGAELKATLKMKVCVRKKNTDQHCRS